jgi:predicted HicB family RNase H-like nuclease
MKPYKIKRRDLQMPATKAQQKAVTKYMKENYDEIKVRMPKGKKDIIKAHAESRGESVNAFIGRAIDETMEREQ